MNGNDKWSGRIKTPNASKSDGPLATIEQAKENIKKLGSVQDANDTIYVHLEAGYYDLLNTLVFTPEDVGNKYIVFQAEYGEEAVISGGKKINFSPKLSEKVQEIVLKDMPFFEQLYLNGRMLQRAREPNEGFFYVQYLREDTLQPGRQKSFAPTLSQYYLKSVKLDKSIIQSLSKISENDMQMVLITFLYKWMDKKVYFNKVDPLNGQVVTQPSSGMKDFVQGSKGVQFYMENSRVFLDAPGEWFWDAQANKLYCRLEGRIAKKIIDLRAPILETLVSLQGKDLSHKVKNITFRNIVFEYSAHQTPKDGLMAQQTSPFINAAVMANYADNIIFDKCEFRNINANAIWFKTACSSSKIVNSYFHELGAGAIKIGDYKSQPPELITKNIVVHNNIISGGNKLIYSVPAIAIYLASDNRLTNNQISNFKYTGISNGFTWGATPTPNKNNYIGYNYIDHLGWGIMDDMGGIYSVGSSENSILEYNVIHDIYCYRYGAYGIYLDQGSAGLTIRNNIVYNCESAGLICGHAKRCIITNNVFSFNKTVQLFFGYAKDEEARGLKFVNNIICWDKGRLYHGNMLTTNFESDNNCYWAYGIMDGKIFNGTNIEFWRKKSRKDLNSIVKDPVFMDSKNGDFSFRSTSITALIGFVPINVDNIGVKAARPDWIDKIDLTEGVKSKFKKSVANKSIYNSN
ncbi:right-handed parallel beta-helix repeat-containing protein [Solitalea sp. MAHUQ-68]|uniref:Right-handed parallel beta-helix repeat-containing protein n=1 Tax=Solitalea agri TaxID=2953739 RepID=A0A9X2JC36_9SPHI|nr:right-handed parallel beta-helix repeat-containing protein [Solitalea agri]MCO4293122.1 right-handed parallel beta-helix repeat-containing protein [Solitalea agri]